MRRKPIAYGAFFTDIAWVNQEGGDRALSVDRTRFDSSIERIAKAIYFHIYSVKWILPMFVKSPNFFVGSTEHGLHAHEPSARAIEATREYLQGEPNRGENAEVFMYRIRCTDGMYAFAALFYEQFEVYAASSQTLAADAA